MGEPIALRQVPKLVADAMWGLVTVVIIMGGILSGVFTPTESAAVACVYAFLVTMFIYRDYRWRELPHLVHRVVKTVAMVMMLIGFSVAFGYMMAIMQIPAKVTQVFLGISENKYVFLLLVNLLLLLLGTFMDVAPMLLICTPIFMPVILKLGIDPVHFGMIMILNLGIGLITPPVGPTLFVGCAIGKVTMEQVSKELWPFYGAMCLALLLVTYIPGDLALAAAARAAVNCCLIRPLAELKTTSRPRSKVCGKRPVDRSGNDHRRSFVQMNAVRPAQLWPRDIDAQPSAGIGKPGVDDAAGDRYRPDIFETR